ncbi:hypothetical protein MC885_021050, partial [Smutsia gigantea]
IQKDASNLEEFDVKGNEVNWAGSLYEALESNVASLIPILACIGKHSGITLNGIECGLLDAVVFKKSKSQAKGVNCLAYQFEEQHRVQKGRNRCCLAEMTRTFTVAAAVWGVVIDTKFCHRLLEVTTVLEEIGSRPSPLNKSTFEEDLCYKITIVVSSSSLTMSENLQNSSLLGISNSLHLSLPMMSHMASSLTEIFGTSFQPLMGSAYLYQHSSTTMLSGVMSQSQISTSAASYICVFAWDITGSTEKKSSSLRDFTVTVTDQNTAMSMATQYDKTSDVNNMGHSLSLPYQEGSQVYYYNQGTLGPLLSGELVPCLQSYGSVSYTGSRPSAPQPEMVVLLKEIQPTGTLPPVSTSGIYYSESVQPITETHFQPPSQTFCPPQTPEYPKTSRGRNIQTLESNPPLEVEGISVIASVQSSRTENNNLEDIKTKLSKPLDACQIPIENQDDVLLPIQTPDIHQLLVCIDPLGQEKQLGSENTDLGKNSQSLRTKGHLEMRLNRAVVLQTLLPCWIFSSLKDFDQSKGPEVIKTEDTRAIELNKVWERSHTKKGSSGQTRKNKIKPLSHSVVLPRTRESALGNSGNPKDPHLPPATKPWLNTLREGKSLEKTHVKAQKPDGSVEKECPSPSQDELPPPGKVKLASSSSSSEATVSGLTPASFGFLYPAWLYKHSSTYCSRFIPASSCIFDISCVLISTNSTQPDLPNSTQTSFTQSTASRPVPYRTSSCTSLQQEPIPTALLQHVSTQASNPVSTPRILLPTTSMKET